MKLTIVTIGAGSCSGVLQTIASIDSQQLLPVRHVLVLSSIPKEELGKIPQRSYRELVIDQDTSLYNAMNIGLRRASGDLVVFLNAGDELYDCKTLARVARIWDGHSVLCGRSIQKFQRDLYLRPRIGRLHDLGWSAPHQACYVPLAMRLPEYEESGRIGADSKWMLEIRDLYSTQSTTNILCRFQLGGLSNSPSLRSVQLRWKHEGFKVATKELTKMLLHRTFGSKYAYRILFSRRFARSVDLDQ